MNIAARLLIGDAELGMPAELVELLAVTNGFVLFKRVTFQRCPAPNGLLKMEKMARRPNMAAEVSRRGILHSSSPKSL